MTAQAPLEDYALLGDTRTAALVSSAGSIDWWCVPRFDSGPLCARLVGGDAAGHLDLGPATPGAVISRDYVEDTPVLRTRWHCHGGAQLTLTEGMVSSIRGRLLPRHLLVRRIEAQGQPVAVRWAFAMRRPWSTTPLPRRAAGPAVILASGPLVVSVQACPPLPLAASETGTTTVVPGRPLTVTVSAGWAEPAVHVHPDVGWHLLGQDADEWRAWTEQIPTDLPFRSAAVRSAVVLRLLTHSPTGAPVAAPTTSLPEAVGGVRNWDYRYTWPRDASIGVAAFLGLGLDREARMFLRWLLHASRLDRPRLPVVLTLDGRRAPAERRVDGWPGYQGSVPVRTGNEARTQHQLDGYGWLIDAAYVFDTTCASLDGETWRAVASFADFVAARWAAPDAGIWEVRINPRHHTHSKLMAWLALDRALRLASRHRVSARRRLRWAGAREAIGQTVRQQGFHPALGSYTRELRSGDLDAALLLLPVLDFEPATSPRINGTVEAIRQDLSAGGPYLYRYPPGTDGLPGHEGAFLPCSFWLVQALARLGRTDEALKVMNDLLTTAPLGLFAEELDPSTGRMTGNFPQALTHAALLQAVLALRAAGINAGTGT